METRQAQGMPLPTLAAMVVGSMVGAGVFSLPQQFASGTGVAGALITWTIAGTGMLMLALVFQSLAVRQPDLNAGVYAYAKAGFGEYLGFFSAFGYWASACMGNTTYWVLIMSTIGAVLPVLGEGDTFVAVLVSSIGVWTFFLLVRRGVREAAVINRVVTVAKLVPILVFIVLMLFYLDPAVFADNITTGGTSLFTQVRGTMLITVFVFLGVEGASVYSRHARRREDIGKATVLGFLSVLAVFASVTIVSYGILPAGQIAELRQPSMAGVMEAAVGTWGSVFISVGLIISVGGAYLAWSLMSAEVLFAAAKDGDMPRFLKRTNASDVPERALLMSSILVQIMLVVVTFSEDAFDFALDLTSSLSLVPYLLAAGYALKLALTRGGGLVVGALATAYTIFLLYAAGPTLLLLSFIIYAPATVLFVMARREQGRRLFRPPELVILAVSVLGALTGIVLLATHAITT